MEHIYKKFKTNRIVSIIFIAIYAILFFVRLFEVFMVTVVDFSMGTLILFLINVLRTVIGIIIFTISLYRSGKLIKDREYVYKYFMKYKPIIGIILSCLITPFYMIITINEWKAYKIYINDNSDSNAVNANKNSTAMTVAIVIAIILGISSSVGFVVSVFMSGFLEYQLEYDKSRQEEISWLKLNTPSIKIHYNGKTTDLFDQYISFDAFDRLSYDGIDCDCDDTVSAYTSVFGRTKCTAFLFKSNKRSKIEDMSFNYVSINYGDRYYVLSDEDKASDYITINDKVINYETSYEDAKAILREFVDEKTSDYESINQDGSSYSIINSAYSISISSSNDTNMLRSIVINRNDVDYY